MRATTITKAKKVKSLIDSGSTQGAALKKHNLTAASYRNYTSSLNPADDAEDLDETSELSTGSNVRDLIKAIVYSNIEDLDKIRLLEGLV